MNRNGIVHLDCWSIKIFSLLVVLSALIFILCSFCPMVLLSILAFLCPPTWSHDENVDCPHLYHVITCSEKIWSYTLIVIVLKYFPFECFVRFDFYPLGLLSYGAFVHFGVSLSAHVIAWRECWLSTPVSCDHMNRNGIIHLDCWSINSYSASHDKWCTAILWNRIMTAQCEGMGEVGSARNEPALLPPCPSIRVLSYSNCQEIHSCQQTGLAV